MHAEEGRKSRRRGTGALPGWRPKPNRGERSGRGGGVSETESGEGWDIEPRMTEGGSQAVHVLLHGGFLTFDAFDEFELGAAAVEIVSLAVGAEIEVTAEVIGQEA